MARNTTPCKQNRGRKPLLTSMVTTSEVSNDLPTSSHMQSQLIGKTIIVHSACSLQKESNPDAVQVTMMKQIHSRSLERSSNNKNPKRLKGSESSKAPIQLAPDESFKTPMNFTPEVGERLQNEQQDLELNELAALLMPPKIVKPTYEPPTEKYTRRRSTCPF
mmetsp:Transcript_18095/g.26776  ORF Transcript_18095/g.26776 Transcript_18095/m.26776 type:complete len:163 (-) Transcript_18095:24-512(-)